MAYLYCVKSFYTANWDGGSFWNYKKERKKEEEKLANGIDACMLSACYGGQDCSGAKAVASTYVRHSMFRLGRFV